MTRAIYPGSFDPITFGHLDVIKRASDIVDELIVGVLNNNSKSPLFSVEERVRMIKDTVQNIHNVRVMSFEGLSVDFAEKMNAQVLVRGLRAVTDFEYELQLSLTNRKINPNIDTIFFNTSIEYAYLSSSTVKEIAYFGGDISDFVPDFLVDKIYDKLNEKRR